MDVTLWETARRLRPKPAPALALEDRLGQDRPRRIAGAQEQHIVDAIAHDGYPQLEDEVGAVPMAGAQHVLVAALADMASSAGLSP